MDPKVDRIMEDYRYHHFYGKPPRIGGLKNKIEYIDLTDEENRNCFLGGGTVYSLCGVDGPRGNFHININGKYLNVEATKNNSDEDRVCIIIGMSGDSRVATGDPYDVTVICQKKSEEWKKKEKDLNSPHI